MTSIIANNNNNNNNNNINNNTYDLINKFLNDGDSLQYLNDIVGERQQQQQQPKQQHHQKQSSSSSSSLSFDQSNETDLLNKPEKLESYFISIVDLLIDLKKYLNTTVDKELENSSHVDIIGLQSNIVKLDERKSDALHGVNAPSKGIASRVESIVDHNDQLRKRLASVDDILEILDYFQRYNQLSTDYEHNFHEKRQAVATGASIPAHHTVAQRSTKETQKQSQNTAHRSIHQSPADWRQRDCNHRQIDAIDHPLARDTRTEWFHHTIDLFATLEPTATATAEIYQVVALGSR
ncbi:hypothetical protein PPL_01750 [Heterostelium album PN500]|uniref:Uncharacterized protein n=1 Tax=Heterostelium pallidum (strain ATCC 26659 / Pp 5 / PN500) TaxID=670386 RepID=D3B0D4_HETP5|nr:hypothetical protein PPL_01750 [Heterostelium album PN500]EFA84758.1 hypothetical protein PPL_01750 [Heterostelium album PN500]|eukprot:XP_020436870.1 hypothetical protein PPL_01750 [Heterostelium album PN500]